MNSANVESLAVRIFLTRYWLWFLHATNMDADSDEAAMLRLYMRKVAQYAYEQGKKDAQYAPELRGLWSLRWQGWQPRHFPDRRRVGGWLSTLRRTLAHHR